MVKRQTVWLSTMMVLSLMLIGYYTMNNEPGVTASKTTPDSTSVVSPTTNGDNSKPATTPNPSSTTSTSQNTNDWYVSTQMQLNQQMEKQMNIYAQTLSNNNATSDQLSQAQQSLNKLQTLQGDLENAHDMIVGKGYDECVIVPSGDFTKFTVYVKTDKLTPDQAVAIIHVVSEQLNVSAINVSVSQKN